MFRKNKKSPILLVPIVVIFILTILIMISSLILSLIGFEGQKTSIENGVLETSLTTINNIFSLEGIQFIFGSSITNFQLFEPLVLLIISCIGVGVLYKSGLLKEFVKPLRKMNSFWLSFSVIIFSLILTFFGEYSYILLIPLIGVVYKEIDRNPMLGIVTVFLGIALGYGSGILYNYDHFYLSFLTEEAARVNVDKNYEFEIFRIVYITIVGTIVFSLALAHLINKRIMNKIPKYTKETNLDFELNEEIKEKEEPVRNGKAKFITSIVGIILLGLLIYSIIPGYYLSGYLLDMSQETYFEKLLSETSPFQNGFVYIIVLLILVISFVFGKLSGNFSSAHDLNEGMAFSFNRLGYLFVLLLFLSQLIGILNWTNIGEVITTKLIDFMSMLEFSGALLILTLFIVVVLVTLIIPETLTKWVLMAPIIVPLFMRSNITPDFTQFIFVVADGVGKSISPIFVYFIIMIGFLYKFNQDNENKITIFGTLRMLLPVVLLIGGLWLLIIIGWYLIGLPLGIGGYSTL